MLTLDNKGFKIKVDSSQQILIKSEEKGGHSVVYKSKKTFKDYLEFRVILLNNGIKSQREFAEFIGLKPAAVSERFSGNQDWKLKELLFMSTRFNMSIDDLCKLLDIAA
jgi:tRNA(His) 5'-end guanylyltransferase